MKEVGHQSLGRIRRAVEYVRLRLMKVNVLDIKVIYHYNKWVMLMFQSTMIKYSGEKGNNESTIRIRVRG